MVIGLIKSGKILGLELPKDFPLWAGVLGLIALYKAIARSLKMAHSPENIRFSIWHIFGGTLEIILFFFIGLWCYQHIPEVKDFIQKLPGFIQNITNELSK